MPGLGGWQGMLPGCQEPYVVVSAGTWVILHMGPSRCTWGTTHISPCHWEGAHRDDMCLGATAWVYTHVHVWLYVVECG